MLEFIFEHGVPNHKPDLAGWIIGIISIFLIRFLWKHIDDLEKIR